MDRTSGQDLYRILWLKSSNSEGWLERRTTYTRSLAVMSMTGYVLGLGDRALPCFPAKRTIVEDGQVIRAICSSTE